MLAVMEEAVASPCPSRIDRRIRVDQGHRRFEVARTRKTDIAEPEKEVGVNITL